MNTEYFLKLCEEKVREFYETIEEFEVFKVWYSKTLQNHKCCMATNLTDNLYFEFTFNGDKKQLYMDVYTKLVNKCFQLENK